MPVPDIVTPEKRSRMMSGIRDKNTRPELLVRRGLHSRGFRFRLHVRDMPGKPDIVLPRYRAVVFVHGCFWHGHDCHLFKWPGSRQEFWRAKILTNQANDEKSDAALTSAGWRICTIWECALKGRTRLPPEEVVDEVARWLGTQEERLMLEGGRQTPVAKAAVSKST